MLARSVEVLVVSICGPRRISAFLLAARRECVEFVRPAACLGVNGGGFDTLVVEESEMTVVRDVPWSTSDPVVGTRCRSISDTSD